MLITLPLTLPPSTTTAGSRIPVITCVAALSYPTASDTIARHAVSPRPGYLPATDEQAAARQDVLAGDDGDVSGRPVTAKLLTNSLEGL